MVKKLKTKDIIISAMMLLAATAVQAQIVIGGNVYGGGNEGATGGSTTVTVRAGDINRVFGGARMANVGGRSFVHLDGAHAVSGTYTLINYVYGGNDIAGTIGTSTALPTELTMAGACGVDKTWNAFVRISSKLGTDGKVASDNQKIYIGQLFAGGNGDYTYTGDLAGKSAPNLARTYLEILGGSIVYAFGGGNKATVTDSTVICVNNPSEVVNSIKAKDGVIDETNGTELLTSERTTNKTNGMGLNPGFTYPTSAAYQIGSFFGGNNQVDMAIRPAWKLLSGKIRNIYSGGNQGGMTSPYGLLLEIPLGSTIEADNVFGGCRKADVCPGGDRDHPLTVKTITGYHFPEELSARVIIRSGNINNVYGGNDISGRVYGGNAVGIYTSINGDVYGGGNGSYPYTDNEDLKNDPTYGDLYYDGGSNALESLEALNNYRPNAEQVSLRIAGTEEKHTIIGGAVYCGGNSATLKAAKAKPRLELKIGSYAYADNVFLGNNGKNMVKAFVKGTDPEDSNHEGVLRTMKRSLSELTTEGLTTEDYSENTTPFSTIDLATYANFEQYMKGCEMTLMPSVVFDNEDEGDPATYIDYKSYIGSLFCGGNVGSMNVNGCTTLNLDHKLVIFDKVVGGCNDANVLEQKDATDDTKVFNAAFNGGLIGTPPAVGETDAGTKLKMNLSGLKIQPKRWKKNGDAYVLDEHGNRQLEWHTIYSSTGAETPPVESGDLGTCSDEDLDRRLKGGNIYGGCYSSGHVNGNVVINLNATLIERELLFDEVKTDEYGEEEPLYGSSLLDKEYFEITKRHTGVLLGQQGMDVLGKALNVFGGGYGTNTEIWGSTTINLNAGYTFQIFGGSEQGVIGKSLEDQGTTVTENDEENETEKNYDSTFEGKHYAYDSRYSCYINIHNAEHPGVSKKIDSSAGMAEAEFVYGGGFFGLIGGNTKINLGNGRIFNSFAGSCYGDILGHTETYIGGDGTTITGFPYIRDYVYGGNDLGGDIKGSKDFADRKSEDLPISLHSADVTTASSYVEYTQGRALGIFGGHFGTYDYADEYKDYTRKPYLDNAFVNFRPIYSAELTLPEKNNVVNVVYGGSQGQPGDVDRDVMQDRSYVLIDIPQDMENYQNMEVFGAGAWSGMGMRKYLDPATTDEAELHKVSAIIDLARGQIKAAYGGSFSEGVTRRTAVNVPEGSTISLWNIFGGSKGESNAKVCDVYEANVNYNSALATVMVETDANNVVIRGGIYGGNSDYRRTIYSKVNIDSKVVKDQSSGYTSTVFGGGFGKDTWSQYTEVNLNSGANVWEAYGGGLSGRVMNEASVTKWSTDNGIDITVNKKGSFTNNVEGGTPYSYLTGLTNPLAKAGTLNGTKYNTNVFIRGYVGGYCYGGGRGFSDEPSSGDVYGTTNIELLGGTVDKDLYAAGTNGSVMDKFGVGSPTTFVASSNAYIKGGSVRNVYGGGWQGAVGKHMKVENGQEVQASISDPSTNDIAGETNVVIGTFDANGTHTTFADGNPAILRNAYGGGEGGPVYGSSHITLNNGHIGYSYNDVDGYVEEIEDKTYKVNNVFVPNDNLKESGNLFGGGYVDNSSVDFTNVTMYGGLVRNSLFGGGEIAAIGRCEADERGAERTLTGKYLAGSTTVTLYGGQVLRNVFGGGKGIDNLGRTGKLYTDGYVYGQTLVNIFGGEVGTKEGVADGYGNVFGGGDIGYVFSGYGTKQGVRYDNDKEGFYYNGTSLTEDCKVLVEPHCRVKTAFDSYAVNDYVDINFLNTLKDKTTDATTWGKLDASGIIIHNAVFAGGNVSTGSDQQYANVNTVLGNATASIHDVYNRDLITIGAVHTGGLYGDGNLTFVDGYRGLNITNYGTDYYHLTNNLDITAFNALSERERAYYEIKYKCKQPCVDNAGKTYAVGDNISSTDLLVLFERKEGSTATDIFNDDGSVNSDYWEENGVYSKYAGRVLNTIQRADFCGVFGSRMVLQGAPDRVPEVIDYTNYTINRVRELSLNKKESVITADQSILPSHQDYYRLRVHGNYFGIYNIVNFLGALTSDVHFSEVRTTDNIDPEKAADGTTTFYQWKQANHTKQKRNNGTSHNEVALASGVYLELTTEQSTGSEVNEKDWGYITGIVELDLINVQPGVGGGFVYAKNVHGTPSTYSKPSSATLTALNADAVTRKGYIYSDDNNPSASDMLPFETSGNFVHGEQTIIDDCYDVGGKYFGSGRSPAHYWFIKGQVYIYEQYISAYTGAPNAYSETVNLPLTITAASNGEMKLLEVQPNYYAYLNSSGSKLSGTDKLEVGGKEYSLNDAITYWDYSQLTAAEQSRFVKMTYVNAVACKINGTEYAAGTYVMDETALSTLRSSSPTLKSPDETKMLDFDFVFRASNNVSHDKGYILTYEVNNPDSWNRWYTPITGTSSTDKISKTAYDILSLNAQEAYTSGPTYRPNASGIYGQHSYEKRDIIDEATYNTYQSLVNNHSTELAGVVHLDEDGNPIQQAIFGAAWLVNVDKLETTCNGTPQNLYKGAPVAEGNYTTAEWNSIKGSLTEAYVCTNTIQLSKTEFIYEGDLMTASQKQAFYDKYNNATIDGESNPNYDAALAKDINDFIVPAYYCTEDGYYGGDWYESTKNYRGLATWSSMSETDRASFTFNYDALDLLIDPLYSKNASGVVIHEEGEKYQYDGAGFNSETQARTNKAGYSIATPLDYTATYDSDGGNLTLTNSVTVINSTPSQTTTTVKKGDEISRTDFLSIPNEQRHYTAISVTDANAKDGGTGYVCYVVNDKFVVGESSYAVGQTVTASVYASLENTSDYTKITPIEFTNKGTYYYCRESYTIGEHGEGQGVNSATGVTGATATGNYTSGTVPAGLVIAEGDENTDGTYKHLVNKQKGFTIHGISPVEYSTLYVSRNSDIYDLSQERIITVIYSYDYEESDESGMHITPVSERHIVNIHLQFKSGIPTVPDINAPGIVLPGTTVTLRTPTPTPGAYEILGGGWELYDNEEDKESHTNGIDYVPGSDPLYWYQDGYWVAYYAKTYLGKTYSNAVQVSVANYHDLAEVMSDENKKHHMYIDNTKVKRDPKIYINDYTRTGQNGLDLLKDLFTMSTGTTPTGHTPLNTSQVGDCKNLEFILRTDISHSGEWSGIGSEAHCFEGTLHGDGHTISGLDNSLFNYLCGEVYNLGVTGSFTTAGIADNGYGYLENCWVKSSNSTDKTAKPVFDNPTDKTPVGDETVRTVHMVNCYYPEENNYTDHESTATYGLPTEKPLQSFYNGEVTYDLNEFYLFKRYCDNKSGVTGNDYSFWEDVSGTLTKQTGHYVDDVAGPYLVNNAKGVYVGSYVESRYTDGDFIYADGEIPTTSNVRQYTNETTGEVSFYPLWPDDYLFFGQALNYDHIDGRTHQETPSAIIKEDGKVVTTVNGNRVYRAPAYFRSKEMGVAHFNPYAVFAQTKKGDTNTKAYPNMTAIDFTGHNDPAYALKTSGKFFYPPLLDDHGLTDFRNIDETWNLLAYTGTTAPAVSATNDKVGERLPDETYSAYSESGDKYRKVGSLDQPSLMVRGHRVVQTGTDTYVAPNDHFLVDKHDFNAPIGYSFADGYRMWYQRIPDTYVDRTKGWEGISIPFKAELVTTHQKGEITHFYEKSWESSNDTHTKIGHEYWLRNFTGVGDSDEGVLTANFTYPDAVSTDGTKTDQNTFLWDYYYHFGSAEADVPGDDANNDDYQKNDANNTYYKETRIYADYPLLAAATPYIIGFPGTTYYEFDLSGNFVAQHTGTPSPDKLDTQTITFASTTGISIGVSDDETLPGGEHFGGATHDDYTFMPNYMAKPIEGTSYKLNAEGSSYVVTSDAVPVPFRPYFTATATAREKTRSIIFSNEYSQLKGVEDRDLGSDDLGNLRIYAKKHKIVVESALTRDIDVRIVNTAGVTISTFTLEPGETVETRIINSGVYIVQSADGRYTKKLVVR